MSARQFLETNLGRERNEVRSIDKVWSDGKTVHAFNISSLSLFSIFGCFAYPSQAC